MESKAAETTVKARRTWTVALDGAAGERLDVRLEHRRDDTWRTFARLVHGSGKAKKVTRGATTAGDQKAATAARDAIVTAAAKGGWTRREAKGGFAGRPDAFDLAHLPRPTAQAKK